MFTYTVILDIHNVRRKDFVYKSFKRLGISCPSHTNAIMAKEYSDEEIYSKAEKDTFLTKTEIACALSHQKVYEEFLLGKDNCIAIFEDDVDFTEDCTLIRLETIMKIVNQWEEPFVLALQENNSLKQEKIKVDESLSIYSCYEIFGGYGYIINRSAIERILTLQDPICYENDAFTFFYYLLDVHLFALNIPLVMTSTTIESSIGEERYHLGNIALQNQRYKKRKALYTRIFKKLPFFTKLRVVKKRLAKWLYYRIKKLMKKLSKNNESLGA